MASTAVMPFASTLLADFDSAASKKTVNPAQPRKRETDPGAEEGWGGEATVADTVARVARGSGDASPPPEEVAAGLLAFGDDDQHATSQWDIIGLSGNSSVDAQPLGMRQNPMDIASLIDPTFPEFSFDGSRPSPPYSPASERDAGEGIGGRLGEDEREGAEGPCGSPATPVGSSPGRNRSPHPPSATVYFPALSHSVAPAFFDTEDDRLSAELSPFLTSPGPAFYQGCDIMEPNASHAAYGHLLNHPLGVLDTGERGFPALGLAGPHMLCESYSAPSSPMYPFSALWTSAPPLGNPPPASGPSGACVSYNAQHHAAAAPPSAPRTEGGDPHRPKKEWKKRRPAAFAGDVVRVKREKMCPGPKALATGSSGERKPFSCLMPGCPKAFRRSEHLKRHCLTIHKRERRGS